MGRKRKELRNAAGLKTTFVRHDDRSLKLRLICLRTRLVLMCKSSVDFRALHFVCSGNGTRQILILKTKIKPVSINAAANCNERSVRFDDAMPTLFAQRS